MWWREFLLLPKTNLGFAATKNLSLNRNKFFIGSSITHYNLCLKLTDKDITNPPDPIVHDMAMIQETVATRTPSYPHDISYQQHTEATRG
ncbi:hypothetical protein MKW98_020123 [Papaver atlanticum]|uniref:Uncharacterized protein n=1 Tax=Papaver atlanticum TaxID=357466 RepID=A0AAD4S1A0_9MAGN|nr:hypothetical protein MKW98_020123 [Papaver atlanticum]